MRLIFFEPFFQGTRVSKKSLADCRMFYVDLDIAISHNSVLCGPKDWVLMGVQLPANKRFNPYE